MKDNKNEINNKIWYEFFIRSASEFLFELRSKEKDLSWFSDEEIYRMVAVCDDVVGGMKIFREELKKRVG